MSEKTEQALIALFKEKMDEISEANKNFRRKVSWVLAVFGLAVLSGVYWAGKIDEKVNNINTSVETITNKAEEMSRKQDDLVLFMAREFKYKPIAREYKNGNND